MKILLAILLIAFGCVSCSNTLADRRDLYRPLQGGGPWTREFEKQTKPAE